MTVMPMTLSSIGKPANFWSLLTKVSFIHSLTQQAHGCRADVFSLFNSHWVLDALCLKNEVYLQNQKNSQNEVQHSVCWGLWWDTPVSPESICIHSKQDSPKTRVVLRCWLHSRLWFWAPLPMLISKSCDFRCTVSRLLTVPFGRLSLCFGHRFHSVVQFSFYLVCLQERSSGQFVLCDQQADAELAWVVTAVWCG